MQNDINCSDKINIVAKCNLQFDLRGSILIPYAYTKTIFEGLRLYISFHIFIHVIQVQLLEDKNHPDNFTY